MIPDTPSVDPRPTQAPETPLPSGTVDSHAHVCGPTDRFPPQPDAAYPLPHAPLETYLATLDTLGAAYGVIVQPTPYGFDNSALVDAVMRSNGRLRGVALADATVNDRELEQLADSGVKALRFAYFAPGTRNIGGVGLEQIAPLAPRLRALGLDPHIWAPCNYLVEWLPQLLKLGLRLVLDHTARVDPEKGVDDPDFRRLLDFARNEDIWIKLMPHRLSRQHFTYENMRPFHDALVETCPDRLIWGTDWPFVRMGGDTPDPALLCDLFADWTPDADLRRAILVDNPTRLFGFGA